MTRDRSKKGWQERSERRSRHGDSGAAGLRNHRTRWLVSLVVMAGLIGLVWFRWTADKLPDLTLPVLRLDMAVPEVARRIEQARQQVAAKPRSAQAWGRLGMVLFAHQFEAETTHCLERAARLDRQEFRWPYLLAMNLAVSEPEAAATRFREAIRLRSEYAPAHLRLGELLTHLQKLEEANSELETAQRLDSHNPRVLLSLARLHLLRGDNAACLSVANQAAQIAPDVASIHELLAEVHQRLGHRQDALDELKIAQQASPDSLPWNDPVAAEVMSLRQDANWCVEQANSLLAMNQIPEAIQQLRLALQRDERDPRIFSQLIDVLTKTRHFEEAQGLLDRAEKRHPLSAMVFFQKGSWLFQRGQFESAAVAFQRAIKLKPDYAIAHFNLAQTWLKLNQPEPALGSFQRAIQFRPDFFDAYLAAAKLTAMESQREAAAEYLRQALRLKPNHREAQHLLDQISP